MHVEQKFIKNTRFVGILTKDAKTNVGQNLGAMMQRLVHFTRRKTFVRYTPAGMISVMLLQCNVCEKDHFLMYFIPSFGE